MFDLLNDVRLISVSKCSDRYSQEGTGGGVKVFTQINFERCPWHVCGLTTCELSINVSPVHSKSATMSRHCAYVSGVQLYDQTNFTWHFPGMWNKNCLGAKDGRRKRSLFTAILIYNGWDSESHTVP